MSSVWSLDDVLIGGSLMTPDALYETFDEQPSIDVWTFWPNGHITEYCLFNTRSVLVLGVLRDSVRPLYACARYFVSYLEALSIFSVCQSTFPKMFHVK